MVFLSVLSVYFHFVTINCLGLKILVLCATLKKYRFIVSFYVINFFSVDFWDLKCLFLALQSYNKLWNCSTCLISRSVFSIVQNLIIIFLNISFSLVCAVSYTTQAGEKMYFRKFFKFQVQYKAFYSICKKWVNSLCFKSTYTLLCIWHLNW